ncbi:MAG: OmpA family protein [Flavipsychrobacter sp.]|nr:OmpA family protein [Flavipsychrobacter sp.]
MRKSTFTILLAALLPAAAGAQRYLGVSQGNYSGTNSVYLNPANLGDFREKFNIDLFSLNFGLDNNLATINSSEIFKGLNGNSGDALTLTNGGKFSLMLPYAEVRGPGTSFSINSKHGLAVTTRLRTYNQLHDFSQDIYRTVQGTAGTSYTSQGNQFNYTLHTWGELGLSYGGVIYENKKHMIKAGATVRYLHGGGYVSFKSNNLDMSYNAGNDMVTISNTDLLFATTYRVNDTNSNAFADKMQQALKGLGMGFGGDVGFVYEFRPNYQKYTYDMDGKTGLYDRSQPTYMLRFSAAVTDIGGITYKKDNSTLSLRNTGNVAFDGNNLKDSVTDYNSLKAFAANKNISIDSSNSATTKVGLPTALVLNLDYNIANVKGLYANLMYMGNLVDRQRVGNSIYSQVTLTPRYEIKMFSVGIPVTYNFMNNSVKAGLGLRLGGFIIGSDDMLAFMSNGQYGANFYMGLSVPFHKKRVKDSDGDLVSNKRDKCPNEKGVLEMDGCPNPDKDGDGILDKDDKCPDVAGSKTALGCPDADLDSLADAEDRCPNEAGPVALQGCPDRDGDGVADRDDACPDEKGLPAFQGCPDRDGDGIPDNTDACPDDAGPSANNGCPDTDNDGVPDHQDKCPTVPGTVNNNGCPEVSVEVKKRLAFAATAIQFETGKAVIKPASFKMLDEIVQILNDYPDYYMSIDGHTDNVGKPEKNLVLSQDRANAVKNYFVSKGISESRLQTNGYGDTQPVGDNKTKAGKAQNRRVAMDLHLKD